MSKLPFDAGTLAVELARQVDAACDRFEAAWRAGQRPRIEDYLAAVPEAARDRLLRELVPLEMTYRRRAGETPQQEEYHARFPALNPHEAETQPGDAAAPRPEAAAVPDFIGKYRVVEWLGRGGQAEVFRAVHPTLGRDVVVKWAHQSLPAAAHHLLIEEGKVLARLEAPGLVRVYDVDLYEGRPFMVMEFVQGRTLQQQLKDGPPSPRAAAAVVASLAETLEHVHQQGACHRDLKPANVLIDAGGRPRLLDFGLALMDQPWSEAHRREGDVSGTFEYMAPEQAKGEMNRIGPRTDVFGLGGILYALLTGRPPYQDADVMGVWEKARQGIVTPPRQLNPRVPRALERICLKALDPDPARRYASAASLRSLFGGSGAGAGSWRPSAVRRP